MVRRNRKKVNASMVPAPFVAPVILCSILALGYLWIGAQCESVGREIKDLERESESLAKQYLNEEYRWTRMKSLANIEDALARYNITMTWPRRGQVVRMTESPVIIEQLAEHERDAMSLASLERVVRNE